MATIQIDIPTKIFPLLSSREVDQDAIDLLAATYEIAGLLTKEQADFWRKATKEPGKKSAATDNDRQNKQKFTVFTDGACKGNPGPGGWGTLIKNLESGGEKKLSGGQRYTTNNKMEMTAAIEGLKYTPPGSVVKIVTDSEYLLKGITQWLPNWLRRNWQTTSRTPVKNKELWQEIHTLSQERDVEWTWVKGHSGHPENELCDRLAVAAYQKYL